MPTTDDDDKAREHYNREAIDSENFFKRLSCVIAVFFFIVISFVLLAVIFRTFTGG